MNLIPATFAGAKVPIWQDSGVSYSIDVNEKKLYPSGKLYAKLGTRINSFPRSYDCYSESTSEIDALLSKMGAFGTLVVNGETFINCYISEISDKKELIRGSGKWTYTIKFSQADVI